MADLSELKYRVIVHFISDMLSVNGLLLKQVNNSLRFFSDKLSWRRFAFSWTFFENTYLSDTHICIKITVQQKSRNKLKSLAYRQQVEESGWPLVYAFLSLLLSLLFSPLSSFHWLSQLVFMATKLPTELCFKVTTSFKSRRFKVEPREYGQITRTGRGWQLQRK